MAPIPSWLAWGLTVLFVVVGLRGALKAIRAEAAGGGEGPRPGMIELGIGLGGIALLLPTLLDVYWP
jgi:hypothetical protein